MAEIAGQGGGPWLVLQHYSPDDLFNHYQLAARMSRAYGIALKPICRSFPSCFMNFVVQGSLSTDGARIVLWAQDAASMCAARVACEDIRQEFGVRASNELLRDLASQREVNRRTLGEIANSLFKANRYAINQGIQVAEITRKDLATRRNEFAWGKFPFPPVMGIVDPNPQKMAASEFKEKKERDIVDRMLRLLGYSGFSLSNPNEKEPNTKQKPETGADVLAKVGDARIAFQVTQYNSDVDESSGTRGSRLRSEEAERASAGLLTPAFINPLSMSALRRVFQEKVTKGWSEKQFPDMRLLVAASVPQDVGTTATLLLEARLHVDEMNAQLSPILNPTKFSAAYLYIMMWRSVYEWRKDGGWKKLC